MMRCSRGKNKVQETSRGHRDLSKFHCDNPDKSLCLIILPRGVSPFKEEEGKKKEFWGFS